MTSPVLVLLHSPLVGPGTWRDVAAYLVRAGHEVVTPDLAGAMAGEPPYHQAIADAVATGVDQVGPERALVLVGHSGAGPLLPRIARTVRHPVSALIYVDSSLPYPGESWLATAPRSLVDHLEGLRRDGRLPPWHEWFPPGAIDEILPDPGTRTAFVAELAPLPYAFLTERTSTGDWPGPAGYLLLSEGYRPDAEDARRAGIPVIEQLDHHLAMLTAPAAVGSVLARLLRAVIAG
jgi:pimeloyl-ACP methyl ester carboxylesterase